MENNWVGMHCLDDDSHVVIPDTSCVYVPPLMEEDTIKFHYPGKKKEYTGVVKGISSKLIFMSSLVF